MSSFEGKVIAITGGASGMGLCSAEILASRGAIISLADTNAEGLKTAVKGLSRSEEHMYTVVDVCDGSSVDAWIKSTVDKYGRLDGAVNMAGIISRALTPIGETSDEDWERTINVNARGVFNSMRAQLKVMKEGGSIVNAASVSGQAGTAGNAAYGASKAAVISLTRTGAKEYPSMRINAVAPGSIRTPMQATADKEISAQTLQTTIMKRRAEAEEVTRVVVFLLGEEASFVTGAIWNVDGGWIC